MSRLPSYQYAKNAEEAVYVIMEERSIHSNIVEVIVFVRTDERSNNLNIVAGIVFASIEE